MGAPSGWVHTFADEHVGHVSPADRQRDGAKPGHHVVHPALQNRRLRAGRAWGPPRAWTRTGKYLGVREGLLEVGGQPGQQRVRGARQAHVGEHHGPWGDGERGVREPGRGSRETTPDSRPYQIGGFLQSLHHSVPEGNTGCLMESIGLGMTVPRRHTSMVSMCGC